MRRYLGLGLVLVLFMSVYHLNNRKSKEEGVQIMQRESVLDLEANNLATQSVDAYPEYIELLEERLDVPEYYFLSSVREKIRNGEEILLIRYSPLTQGEVLGGEHYSVIMNKDSKEIIGFAHMTLESVIDSIDQLPSEIDTETVVLSFLDRFDSTIFDGLEHRWTRQHDETMDGDTTISGIKYKNYVPSNDTYTWFVVDHRQQIIAFETGMLWDNGPATEQWFRDDVLIKDEA